MAGIVVFGERRRYGNPKPQATVPTGGSIHGGNNQGGLVMRRVAVLLTIAGVFGAMAALAGPAAAQTADDPAMEEPAPPVLSTALTGE